MYTAYIHTDRQTDTQTSPLFKPQIYRVAVEAKIYFSLLKLSWFDPNNWVDPNSFNSGRLKGT